MSMSTKLLILEAKVGFWENVSSFETYFSIGKMWLRVEWKCLSKWHFSFIINSFIQYICLRIANFETICRCYRQIQISQHGKKLHIVSTVGIEFFTRQFQPLTFNSLTQLKHFFCIETCGMKHHVKRLSLQKMQFHIFLQVLSKVHNPSKNMFNHFTHFLFIGRSLMLTKYAKDKVPHFSLRKCSFVSAIAAILWKCLSVSN